MSNKVYVGNLPYSFTAQDLSQLFAEFGAIKSTEVIMDRMTGRSRGFGFVEFDSTAAMLAAITTLHGKDIEGRSLTVNEARDRVPGGGGAGGPGAARSPRPPRTFSGGGPSGGQSGGGGGGGSGARPSYGGGSSGGGRPERRDRGDRGDRRYSDGGSRRMRDDFDDEG